MKENFKIDYISRTAAHYTSFTLAEESRRSLRDNLHDQAERARQVQAEIGRRARDKALAQIKGGRLNIYG